MIFSVELALSNHKSKPQAKNKETLLESSFWAMDHYWFSYRLIPRKILLEHLYSHK